MRKENYIFGIHTVSAAISNGRRTIHGLWLTKSLYEQFREDISQHNISYKLVDNNFLDSKVSQENHQGIVASVAPFSVTSIEDILFSDKPNKVVVILDQVTDPHNVGAILRSAAAFNCDAIIQQDKNSPDPNNPLIAKIASGGAEFVPIVNVTNLSRAIDTLKDNSFWVIGLDERGSKNINEIDLTGNLAIVMGKEGSGMRRLIKENCDILTRLPTNPKFPTLNVSNAAAIALYEIARKNS